VKIEVRAIPPEGLALREEISPKKLELETETVSFKTPLTVEAFARRAGDTVIVKLNVRGLMSALCARCLTDFDINIDKELDLSYQIDKTTRSIELDSDIREEIIVDYPIKALCRVTCKGLCTKCGKNLNEGGCSCGTT